jgi:hypothetical protein
VLRGMLVHHAYGKSDVCVPLSSVANLLRYSGPVFAELLPQLTELRYLDLRGTLLNVFSFDLRSSLVISDNSSIPQEFASLILTIEMADSHGLIGWYR